jgi:hypothetical protein
MSIMPVQQPQIPQAGRWKSILDEVGTLYGGTDKIPDTVKEKAVGQFLTGAMNPDAEFAGMFRPIVEQQAYAMSPKGRREILEQQLEFDKARGEQQMRYRMINDTIGNLGQAARAAFGGYGVSPDYMGQAIGNIGNAYLAGLQAVPRVAPQVGQRYF